MRASVIERLVDFAECTREIFLAARAPTNVVVTRNRIKGDLGCGQRLDGALKLSVLLRSPRLGHIAGIYDERWPVCRIDRARYKASQRFYTAGRRLVCICNIEKAK